MGLCIMNLSDYLKISLKKAIDDAGNMRKFSELSGVEYSTINRFNSGIQDIENMPLRTMIRLFPELRIFCFEKDYRQGFAASGNVNLEAKMLELFRGLSPDEQLKCITMVAANFPDKIRMETKR